MHYCKERCDMIKIIKKKINMSDELKVKINWSCKFNNRPYQIIEGHLRIVEHTNLAYVEPHNVIIGDILYMELLLTILTT